MDKITVEQAIIASKSDSDRNSDFTNNVMYKIQKRKWRYAWRVGRWSAVTIASAVLCLSLLSTAAYAAYSLWINPSVNVSANNSQNGHVVIAADFKNCQGANLSSEYEVSKNVSLNQNQVAQLLKARCQINAIKSWRNTFTASNTQMINESYQALTVQKVDGQTIELLNSYGETVSLSINNETQFFSGGVKSDAKAIKAGDIVMYVERDSYSSPQGGAPTSRELLGVIKMDLPIEAYSISRQNMIYERTPCRENTQEKCVQTANQEIYPRVGEGGSGKIITHQIQGRIAAINGGDVTIQTSSGAKYIVKGAAEPIAQFNATSNYTVTIGDAIEVQYLGAQDKTIDFNSVGMMSLLLDMKMNKTDTPVKY